MFKKSSMVSYQSRMGTTFTLYGGFNRTLIRTYGFSMNYVFENGISYGLNPYNPTTNVDNELIGSSLMIYFGLGLRLSYYINNHWEVGLGAEGKHISNGALDRPNKGANTVGLSVRVKYYLERQPKDLPSLTRFKNYPRGFYYNLTAGLAGKTLLDEWMLYYYTTTATDPHYKTDKFRVYPAATFSTDVMYRYALRFGSGIGIDMQYAPYVDRIKTIDNAAGRSLKHERWAFGLALKHEVFYNNLAMHVSIGYYLKREMGFIAKIDEKPYYERLGLRYYFPKLGNLFVGYHIKAHLTKADFMEFCVGVKLR